MDGCRSWAAVLAVVLGVAAAIAYHLVLSVPWRYGLAHCRLTNHRVEGMKTGCGGTPAYYILRDEDHSGLISWRE